jgi:glyoxylase-like metal-dependent hydrolase (beta-lactamase superfamily II)
MGIIKSASRCVNRLRQKGNRHNRRRRDVVRSGPVAPVFTSALRNSNPSKLQRSHPRMIGLASGRASPHRTIAVIVTISGLICADLTSAMARGLLPEPGNTHQQTRTPMANAYEIYALRYATMSPRTPHMNFLVPDPHDTTAADLDYFVWLIRGAGRDVLVDTGFNAEEASLRSRKLTLNPVDALAAFGVAASDIRDVVVTHLHYDHAGNLDRFPNARFHLQEREMSYATGRCMCNGMLRHPFSVEHVTQMVRHVFGDRVTFHSGDGEIAPGITVHRVGGHSDGLQVVRVETARGPVVLASDAAHYYANLQRRSPFPIVYNVGDMAQGWEIVERLAGHPDRFIPGHDPIVAEIYPRASDKVDAFALHKAPSRSFVK